MNLSSAIEAVLFAAGDSVPIKRLSLVLDADETEIENFADILAEKYIKEESGIRLLKFNDKLQLCSAPEYSQIITKALETRKPPMLSQSALETLAITAYFQPVTKAYIDRVRGVDSSYTVSVLVEKKLIAAAGKLEAPGRPTLYVTTDAFSRTMGIESLDELPQLPELSSNEGIEKLRAAIDEIQKTEKLNGQIVIENM